MFSFRKNPEKATIHAFIYNCDNDDEVVGEIIFDRVKHVMTLRFNKDQQTQFERVMGIYISGMHIETRKEVE